MKILVYILERSSATVIKCSVWCQTVSDVYISASCSTI